MVAKNFDYAILLLKERKFLNKKRDTFDFWMLDVSQSIMLICEKHLFNVE